VPEPKTLVVPLDERPTDLVLAAGGLVVRMAGARGLEVAIVHRPGREDWSYPKGKVEPNETLTECALREVLEETGLVCRIVSFVGTTEYRDRKDRPKIVTYWAMTYESGSFVPCQEVDEMRWVTPSEAMSLLSYDRDHELLGTLQLRLPWIFGEFRQSA
jgi:8-oxo-dGTP pyrophosphatase MutT (NUDIX family)